jgi:hypothetical protein
MRCLQPADDVERHSQGSGPRDRDIQRSRRRPKRGDGWAGPLKQSIRWFQATHARRSASFRASAARSAECRTEPPQMLSRDFVPITLDAPAWLRSAGRHRLSSEQLFSKGPNTAVVGSLRSLTSGLLWWTHKGSNLGPLPCEGESGYVTRNRNIFQILRAIATDFVLGPSPGLRSLPRAQRF